MNTTTKANTTGFAGEVLRLATTASEVDTGPLALCAKYQSDIANLHGKLEAARKSDDSTSQRKIILDYWRASPDGDQFTTDKAALSAVKNKTTEQGGMLSDMLKRENKVNVMLIRACDAFAGIAALRRNGRDVRVAPLPNTSTYVCYVKTPAEFESVRFSIANLKAVPGLSFTAATSTADIRKECSTFKQGAANKDKGNAGERLTHGPLAKAMHVVDTSLSAIVNGQSIVAGPAVKKAAHELWARLDATLSDADKAAARKAFAALAAPVPNVVTAVKDKIAGKSKRKSA